MQTLCNFKQKFHEQQVEMCTSDSFAAVYNFSRLSSSKISRNGNNSLPLVWVITMCK